MNRVNGSSLKTIREFYGLNQSQLAKKLGLSQPMVSKIEKDEKNLDEEYFSVFIDYFNENFFRNHVEVANQKLFYRKLSSINKKTLNMFEARVNLIHNTINSGLDIVDIESEKKIPQIDPELFDLNMEYIATEVRLRLGIGRGPILDIVKKLEDFGVIIHFFNYDFISEENRKFDGVSFYVEGTPVILINNKIPNSRKVFTIAHELGHLVMHSDNIINISRDIEKEANNFAAAFLAPEKDIKSSLRRLNLSKLEELKTEWNMSLSALVYRAYTLGTITEQTLRFWMMKLAPFRKKEPNEFGLSNPKLLNQVFELLNKETEHSFFKELGYNFKLQEELFNFRDKSKIKLRII